MNAAPALDRPLPPIPASLPEPTLSRRQRVAVLLGPLLALATAWLLTLGVGGTTVAGEIAAAAAASAALLGTTTILAAGALGDGGFATLSALDVALVILVLNTALTVFYVGASDLFERAPLLGPLVTRARARARAHVQTRPWIRRWATLGLVLFVLSPLPASGVFGGALAGRVAGLTRARTAAAVGAANAVVCGGYALLADTLRAWMDAMALSTSQRAALFVGVALAVVVLARAVATRARARRAPVPAGRPPSA